MASKKGKTKNKPKDSESSAAAQFTDRKIITDARFASVHSDPRFQKVPRNTSMVAIDSRFNRVLTDKSFFVSSSAPLDKRGKPKKRNSETSLRHYYRIEEEKHKQEEEEEEEEEAGKEIIYEDDEEVEEERKLGKLGPVKSGLESSSESEVSESEDDESYTTTDTDEGEDEGVEEEEEEPQVQENIPEIERETRRLAVVNMDWRYVKAVDLYVVLSSFIPKDGQILSVAVYPSEFGLQRMKEEEVHGPVGLFDDENDEDNEDNEDEIDYEKLRAYETSKLRYYYAVVECDSSATADYLYKACDGVEFERSSNKLDLRFIPDSMEFKHPPRDIATGAPAGYEGLDFQTRALQHSRIQLSWDEDEPDRVKTLKRKFNADQLAELELKEFLASDESESDGDEDENDIEDQSAKRHKKRDMYRALIQSGDVSEGDGEEDGQDMEVTFNTGLEDISKRILEKKGKKSETVWEAYLRKRSEKKKARKNKSKYSSEDEGSDTDQEAPEQPDDFFVEEPSVKRGKKAVRGKIVEERLHQDADKEAEASIAELELLVADDKGEETGHKRYNLKPKKAKGRKGKEVPDEDKIPDLDYNDPRFSALFTSPQFALDPTNPEFQRWAALSRHLVQTKQNRQEVAERERMKLSTTSKMPSDERQLNKDEQVTSEVLRSKKDKLELSSLVKSIKMKSKQVQFPSNGSTSKKDAKLQSADMEEMEQPHDLSTLVQSVKKKSKNLKRMKTR